MNKRICPFCGAKVSINVCEDCGFEMPESIKVKSEKTPHLKKKLTQEERYKIIKAKTKKDIILKKGLTQEERYKKLKAKVITRPEFSPKTEYKSKIKTHTILKSKNKTLSSKLTFPFDKVQVAYENQNHLMKYIDFKPYSYKKLFQNSEYVNFTLNPVEYIIFSLYQEFRYRNDQEIHRMRYNNTFGLVYDDKIQVYEKSPFTKSLEDTISKLKSSNIDYILRNLSTPRLDVRSIKNKIQDKTTKELSYFGENSQFYKKKLIPNFGNITIHKRGIAYLWDCNISTKFTNKFEFTVKISNGKINPSGSFRQKEVTCKNCQKFVVPLHKKVCNSCKLNLCYNCSIEKKIFHLVKRSYCPECIKLEIKKKIVKISYKDF